MIEVEDRTICWICSSGKHVDDHHYDCKEGELSPETVPLCRRCHQTYHIWGVEWFEDEYLDKIIEIENKGRQIVYASLKNPTKPLVLLKREDIRRSDYWNKKHAITNKRKRDSRQLDLPITVGVGSIDPMNTPRLF